MIVIGNSFTSTNNTTNNKDDSTKYATVYQMSNTNNYQENYTININRIFGDAVFETSTKGTGSTSWYQVDSVFMGEGISHDSISFLTRGGYATYNPIGNFGFESAIGNSSNKGYRISIIIK